MKVFLIVLAREGSEVERKTRELDGLGLPYIIVCGEKINHPKVLYRQPRGKYDAINFAAKYVPKDTEIVALNDVDTEIYNLEASLRLLNHEQASLVYARVDVKYGPQVLFYSILDALRKRVPIAASGELMLVRHHVFRNILPLKGCKAEDSYILFKVLENGYKALFCGECYVSTRRTSNSNQEEEYKRRTVGGIYQALAMTKPPVMVRVFYRLLPFATPLLLLFGDKGHHWAKGIILGFVDYLRGDRSAKWRSTYGSRQSEPK